MNHIIQPAKISFCNEAHAEMFFHFKTTVKFHFYYNTGKKNDFHYHGDDRGKSILFIIGFTSSQPFHF